MATSLCKSLLAAALAIHLCLASPVAHAHGLDTTDNPKSSGCTTRLFVAPSLTFGPTRTVWTTTSTHTKLIYCGTCTDVARLYIPLGVPPVVFFETTVTAMGPSVTTDFACGAASPTASKVTADSKAKSMYTLTSASPSSTLAKRSGVIEAAPGFHPGPSTISPGDGVLHSCTSRTVVPAKIPNATLTHHTATVTSTSSIDCGFCKVVCDSNVPKFFAANRYTATVTAETASTITHLACATPTSHH